MLKKAVATVCLLSTLSAHALGLGISLGAGEPLGLVGLLSTTTTYVYAGPVAGIIMLADDGSVVTNVEGQDALDLLALEAAGEIDTKESGSIAASYAKYYDTTEAVVLNAVKVANPLTIENFETGLE